MSPSIMLSNGAYYDYLDPNPIVITPYVVAQALARIPRYTGHTTRFYSVAEHCVRCSRIGPEDEALERLCHDASEAFVQDLPTPLKRLLPDYQEIEDRAHQTIALRFGLTYPYPPSVHIADRVMLATEVRDLLPAPGFPVDETPLDENIKTGPSGDPFVWEIAWLNRFFLLQAGRERHVVRR